MTSTTHPEFNAKTEAVTVAAAFATSIKGRTILITGLNKQGIGFSTAQAFASQSPKCLILAGRSTAKVQECVDSLRQQWSDIDYRLLQVDLSSQKSVRTAASTVMSWTDVPTIDLVINNAGVMNIPERTLTPEGVELHLATNHVGPFLLTNLIMPKLIAAAKGAPKGTVRIINISSLGVFLSALRPSDMNFAKPAGELPEKEKPNLEMLRQSRLPAEESMNYFPFIAYGHSKTCNVLFSVGLSQKLYEKYGILSLSLHPGEMQTELTRHTNKVWLEKAVKARAERGMHFWKSLQQGASTTLVAALDPKLQKPGDDGRGYYLNDCQIGMAPAHAVDPVDAEKLWNISEDFVGEKFAW